MTQQEEMARQLWEEAGKPEGRDDEFWFAAEKALQDKHWEEYDSSCSSADAVLWEVIQKGLKDCITAHGPITERFLESATKRVVRGIVENEEFRQVCPEDVHNKLIVTSLERHFQTLLADVIRYRNKQQKSLEGKLRAARNGVNVATVEKLKEKLEKANARIKQLEDNGTKKKLENQILELSRQVAFWRVMAEGPPKEVKEMPEEPPKLVLPSIPTIQVKT